MSALTTGRCVMEGSRRATVTRLEVTIHDTGARSRRHVPDHQIEGTCEVWIDAAAIFSQLGERALRSKGRKAQAMSGAVVVRAVNVRKVQS